MKFYTLLSGRIFSPFFNNNTNGVEKMGITTLRLSFYVKNKTTTSCWVFSRHDETKKLCRKLDHLSTLSFSAYLRVKTFHAKIYAQKVNTTLVTLFAEQLHCRADITSFCRVWREVERRWRENLIRHCLISQLIKVSDFSSIPLLSSSIGGRHKSSEIANAE